MKKGLIQLTSFLDSLSLAIAALLLSWCRAILVVICDLMYSLYRNYGASLKRYGKSRDFYSYRQDMGLRETGIGDGDGMAREKRVDERS